MKATLACLLLLVATALSQDSPYRKFINQHIKGDMSTNRCDQEIQSRHITIAHDSNECKPTNTFIRATTNLVKAICGQAGEPHGNGLTRSLQPFNIVVCTLKNNGGRRPNCQYRGQARTRKIAIRCENGLPVHFDGDIVHLDN